MNLIYAQGVPPLPAPVELLELRAVGVALAELGLLAVAGGLLGAWVILRRLAFFTHAAGTATFPGLVVAQASGFSPRLAAVGVALGYAGAVERAAHRGRLQADAATALALVVALAGGTILASDVFESGAVVDRLLFGTIIGLDGGDLLVSGAAAVLAALVTLSLGRAFTAVGFDPESSASLGLPTRRADLLLLPVRDPLPALERWYRTQARREIAPRLDAAAANAGTAYRGLTIRSQRTRWASCSSSGAMSFNWRLLLAPPAVLDYVVEHEVCHLEVMDHSQRFWSLLEARVPEWRVHARWLKRYGSTLTLDSVRRSAA